MFRNRNFDDLAPCKNFTIITLLKVLNISTHFKYSIKGLCQYDIILIYKDCKVVGIVVKCE